VKKNIIMIGFTVILIFATAFVSSAASSFNSQGKIVFTNGTSTTSDDVVFDAGDFARLASVCE